MPVLMLRSEDTGVHYEAVSSHHKFLIRTFALVILGILFLCFALADCLFWSPSGWCDWESGSLIKDVLHAGALHPVIELLMCLRGFIFFFMFIFMLCFLIVCKLSRRFTHNSLIPGGLSVLILGQILSVTLMTGPAAQRAIEKQHCYLGNLLLLIQIARWIKYSFIILL